MLRYIINHSRQQCVCEDGELLSGEYLLAKVVVPSITEIDMENTAFLESLSFL